MRQSAYLKFRNHLHLPVSSITNSIYVLLYHVKCRKAMPTSSDVPWLHDLRYTQNTCITEDVRTGDRVGISPERAALSGHGPSGRGRGSASWWYAPQHGDSVGGHLGAIGPPRAWQSLDHPGFAKTAPADSGTPQTETRRDFAPLVSGEASVDAAQIYYPNRTNESHRARQ